MGLLAARMAAFSDDPRGGNPAGVVVGDAFPPDDVMQQLAKDIGYSETVFLAGDGGAEWRARYWSPVSEVPFCGHATIAAAVAVYRQYGAPELLLDTLAGPVPVAVEEIGGAPWATLTSVEPRITEIDPDDLDRLLALLHLARADLDPALPPRIAYAGVEPSGRRAREPRRAGRARVRLRRLARAHGGARLDKRSRSSGSRRRRSSKLATRSRSAGWSRIRRPAPRPPRSAPTCGRSARSSRPRRSRFLQGEEIGRPSRIFVAIPREGGIGVTGTAVPIPPELA